MFVGREKLKPYVYVGFMVHHVMGRFLTGGGGGSRDRGKYIYIYTQRLCEGYEVAYSVC